MKNLIIHIIEIKKIMFLDMIFLIVVVFLVVSACRSEHVFWPSRSQPLDFDLTHILDRVNLITDIMKNLIIHTIEKSLKAVSPQTASPPRQFLPTHLEQGGV